MECLKWVFSVCSECSAFACFWKRKETPKTRQTLTTKPNATVVFLLQRKVMGHSGSDVTPCESQTWCMRTAHNGLQSNYKTYVVSNGHSTHKHTHIHPSDLVFARWWYSSGCVVYNVRKKLKIFDFIKQKKRIKNNNQYLQRAGIVYKPITDIHYVCCVFISQKQVAIGEKIIYDISYGRRFL